VVPASTYRLQFGPTLSFADATDLVGYLADLGIGALYASPLLAATPGSAHGYDVVDPTRAAPSLGGEAGRVALVAALRETSVLFGAAIAVVFLGEPLRAIRIFAALMIVAIKGLSLPTVAGFQPDLADQIFRQFDQLLGLTAS